MHAVHLATGKPVQGRTPDQQGWLARRYLLVLSCAVAALCSQGLPCRCVGLSGRPVQAGPWKQKKKKKKTKAGASARTRHRGSLSGSVVFVVAAAVWEFLAAAGQKQNVKTGHAALLEIRLQANQNGAPRPTVV